MPRWRPTSTHGCAARRHTRSHRHEHTIQENKTSTTIIATTRCRRRKHTPTHAHPHTRHAHPHTHRTSSALSRSPSPIMDTAVARLPTRLCLPSCLPSSPAPVCVCVSVRNAPLSGEPRGRPAEAGEPGAPVATESLSDEDDTRSAVGGSNNGVNTHTHNETQHRSTVRQRQRQEVHERGEHKSTNTTGTAPLSVLTLSP